MITEILSLDSEGKYQLYCKRQEMMPGPPGVPVPLNPVLIYVPGGGFMGCSPTDQDQMMARFFGYGFHVFTFTYPAGSDYRFPEILVYLSKAIKLIRSKRDEWCADPAQIVVGGCSAGAFISAAMGNFWNAKSIQTAADCVGTENRPNLMMLCYGPLHADQRTETGLVYVPNSEYVGKQTPPAYLMHAFDDSIVPVDQSLEFARAMCKAGIPFGMYVVGTADHVGLQNTSRKVNKLGKLTPNMDDWFSSFLLFAKNELGNDPNPQPAMEMLPPPPPEGEISEGAAPLDFAALTDTSNLSRMGTYGGGLRMCFEQVIPDAAGQKKYIPE